MGDFEAGDHEARIRLSRQDRVRLALGEFGVNPEDGFGTQGDLVPITPQDTPPRIGGIALSPPDEDSTLVLNQS